MAGGPRVSKTVCISCAVKLKFIGVASLNAMGELIINAAWLASASLVS